MKISQYAEINQILEKLLEGHKDIFGKKLLGYYVYGSLVWGDFDENASDIDTLCLISSEVTANELARIRTMHEEIIRKYPEWDNRIEVHYTPADGLKNFKTVPFYMANISPGEPLHMIVADAEWIDEWYLVREYAIPLVGTDPKEMIPYISKEEFVGQIKRYAHSFRDRIKICKDSYSLAYAILTICRALYTTQTGNQTSKPAAAKWAMEFLPEYKELLEDALIWRQERHISSSVTFENSARTEEFINHVLCSFFS
ncbi:MAG: DUF4111 domain-containing protein [Acetatifactor sp.]|nr:DUF4111 domain-containing protein [Acetatifactor sp.]